MSQKRGVLARLQAAVVDPDSAYRQFVRAAGVATTGLVLAYGLMAFSVVDLSAAVVATFRIAASVAISLFVLLGVLQFVVIARAYESGTETVAETAQQLEQAAQEVEQAAQEIDETVQTVEEAAGEVETAAEDVDQAVDGATDRVEAAANTVEEATEKAGQARERTGAVEDTAGEVKETVGRERERLPDGPEAQGATDDETAE